MNSFTSMRDILQGFANAMNLISPEVQNHHEKVSYFAYQLADALGLEEKQKRLAFYGALLHDIGGVMKQGENLSLRDLERNAREISTVGAALLRMYPATQPFSEAVSESQTPWERLRSLREKVRVPQLISQSIHLADIVALLLNDGAPVLNQLPRVTECVHGMREREFCPEVLSAFDALTRREAVWMDMLYAPNRFLEIIPLDRDVSLEETVRLTEFMSRIIDFRSPFTAMHSAGVATSAVCLAEKLDMSRRECDMMRIAGNLHDIGKLKIPNAILEKPGKLTDEEFGVMKEHAYYTYMILRDVRGFEQITAWAALHHEKLNGAGYPFRLEAEAIPLGARVMAVADIFSAITEDRPYRKGMTKDRALSVLREDAERGMLSRTLVELLADHFDEINQRRDEAARAASRKYRESLTK